MLIDLEHANLLTNAAISGLATVKVLIHCDRVVDQATLVRNQA